MKTLFSLLLHKQPIAFFFSKHDFVWSLAYDCRSPGRLPQVIMCLTYIREVLCSSLSGATVCPADILRGGMPFWRMSVYCLKIDHDSFLPDFSRFILLIQSLIPNYCIFVNVRSFLQKWIKRMRNIEAIFVRPTTYLTSKTSPQISNKLYRVARKSVNWLVKCTLKHFRNIFGPY
jgi:hypothetical protein